jgi:hypothetical protein
MMRVGCPITRSGGRMRRAVGAMKRVEEARRAAPSILRAASPVLCTGSKLLRTGSHHLCTGSHLLCTGSHLLCTGSHLLCTGSHPLCTGSALLRAPSAYANLGGVHDTALAITSRTEPPSMSRALIRICSGVACRPVRHAPSRLTMKRATPGGCYLELLKDEVIHDGHENAHDALACDEA